MTTSRSARGVREAPTDEPILAVPTAIAGIYGMNFEHIQELAWRHGYFVVLRQIAVTCGFLFYRFRRAGWI